jgi:hypothetical protein
MADDLRDAGRYVTIALKVSLYKSLNEVTASLEYPVWNGFVFSAGAKGFPEPSP